MRSPLLFLTGFRQPEKSFAAIVHNLFDTLLQLVSDLILVCLRISKSSEHNMYQLKLRGQMITLHDSFQLQPAQ